MTLKQLLNRSGFKFHWDAHQRAWWLSTDHDTTPILPAPDKATAEARAKELIMARMLEVHR